MIKKFWPWGQKKSNVKSFGQRKAVLGTSESLGSFLMFGNGRAETPASAISLYEKSSAVSIPINKIVTPFSGFNPVLKEIDTDKITTDHEVLDLLRAPSPLYDGSVSFFETLARYYLITGEAPIVALGNISRPPLELQPLNPSMISVIEGRGGYAEAYGISGNTLAGSYTRDNKKFRYFDGTLREFKLIRSFSTRNNGLLRGQSPLLNAASEARQHILGNSHNISLLEKGGRVSLVFNFEEDITDDDFEVLKDRVRDQYSGPDSAGEIGVTAGGKMTIQELGKSNKDMDFIKSQQVVINATALQYGVPLPLVSNQAATYNNFREANLSLYDGAVLPLADKLFGGLSVFLLPRYGLDPSKHIITYDILSIPALRQRVLDEIKTRKDINIESDNELRRMVGKEPYEGGDSILKPANLLPAGTDLFEDDVRITREQPEIEVPEGERDDDT